VIRVHECRAGPSSFGAQCKTQARGLSEKWCYGAIMLMADVCMNYVIDQALAVTPPECRPDLLCRYVDDLLLLFPNQDSLNRFFTNINSIHKNIVFTNELETNNYLHFLDVLIGKTSTGFIASTYRKPTHTGLYSKWSSFVPLHRKRNLVNSLLRREYDIASSYQLVHTELMNIKRMLSRNGYPNNFLDRCIKQFLKRKYGVTQQRDAPAEPCPSLKYISLQLTHLGSVSNNTRQELSSFIRHKAVVNVKLRCFQSTRKLQSWFSIMDRQALLNLFNVVYKLTCSCGASYIGQTQRNLINGIEEHRTSLSSSVCRHLQANPDHRVDFHNPELRSLAVTTIGDGCRFLNLY